MSARKAALIEAADFAEFYAEERMRLCTDTILHDPILNGEPWTNENFERSRQSTIDGTINSAAYHAAMNIASHLRDLASDA